jgi:hypothetical protein
MKTKQQILEERRLINEGLFSVENILMTLGFFPVIGEFADILLIIHYLRRGENLYAALMLVALIPTVGDALVKPFIRTLQKGKKTLKNTNNLVEALNKNPKVASKLEELVGDKSKLNEAFESVKNNEKYKKYLPKSWVSSIEEGLTSISKVLPKVTPLEAIKSGVKSATTGGKFSTGLKDFYRGERLSKYIAKKGMEPSNFIQKWWINYGAGKDRRDSFRRFIAANNMLELFGLPNVGSFEDKLQNDKNFRDKVADNPQMSEFIAQNSSDADLNPKKETSSNPLSPIAGMMTVPFLKMLANKFA